MAFGPSLFSGGTMETWHDMRARQRNEQVQQIKHLSALKLTQTQAAKLLEIDLTTLNSFIKRNEIRWGVIMQGKKDDRPNVTNIYKTLQKSRDSKKRYEGIRQQ
tara:strand:- start:353 stop:664 length:312 start_codon:yes stop_codon:yes gene_type:complete